MLNTADTITCNVLNEPGNYHFERRCEDCDARALSRLSLGEVEDRYHNGRVTQDQFEAYMHVWAVLSPTGSRPEWRTPPALPAVARIAGKIRHFLEAAR